MLTKNKDTEEEMIPILGKPQYRRDEMVCFRWGEIEKVGKVRNIDAYGTFEQSEEPSYDILVEDNALYKHVRESEIVKSCL